MAKFTYKGRHEGGVRFLSDPGKTYRVGDSITESDPAVIESLLAQGWQIVPVKSKATKAAATTTKGES